MMTLLKYTAQTARRREPTVGQEAVSTRSSKRRPVRSQWSPPRQGRLKTACCLSARGVATAKQRFDRAVGTAGAPFSKYTKIHPFINEIKSHPFRPDRPTDGSAARLFSSVSRRASSCRPTCRSADTSNGPGRVCRGRPFF